MKTSPYDIAIIGGGINGCGIARDAAGRGLSVLLVERHDLASATSSASTKLVHGGLRYLEHYEFALVREALREREVLLAMAPHIIWPLRFVLPHHSGLRPVWMIRLGLFLYDHIGGRRLLPASKTLNLKKAPEGAPLKDVYKRAFEYSDCWVDDARLVLLNALDASARGAEIRTRTEMVTAASNGDHWTLSLRDTGTGDLKTAEARILVNAAGPWVADVLTHRIGIDREASVRLVKGSHIVVPRLFEHEKAYIFQNPDDRVVFAIPYENDFTLIGTTDVDVDADPGSAEITPQETAYLCDAVNTYFKTAVSAGDVVWTYSGVRPLFDDGEASAQETTRDYVLDFDADGASAPLLNIYGGKITTFRHLAEEAVDMMAAMFPKTGPAWTGGTSLPGGDFAIGTTDQLAHALQQACPAVSAPLASRLARTYGTRAWEIIDGVADQQDLGTDFGAGLYQREVEYLIQQEWAMSLEDVLWRRTKLGLRLSEEEKERLEMWILEQVDGDHG